MYFPLILYLQKVNLYRTDGDLVKLEHTLEPSNFNAPHPLAPASYLTSRSVTGSIELNTCLTFVIIKAVYFLRFKDECSYLSYDIVIQTFEQRSEFN